MTAVRSSKGPRSCKLKTPSAGVGLAHPATVTSTATQTLDGGRSLHQWRSIQGQCRSELQKEQHCIQSALNKRRDSGRSSGSHSHSPTAMLEQMQERLHSIAQDMYILNRTCGEEIVRSSLAPARKAAPKKRRRARRNRVRPVKQACSDTIEESISPTDKVAPQRKRARVYKGSPPSSTTHITFNTFGHLNITISHANNSTSHRTIFHKCRTISWSVLNSLRLEANKTSFSNEHHSSCACACLAEHPKIRRVRRDSSGRSSESRTCHTRQRLDSPEQPGLRDEARSEPAYHRDSPAASAALPPPTMRNARRPPKPKQNAQGVPPAARSVAQLPTLTQRLQMEVSCSARGRSTGGQVLLEDSVGQLRWLNRQACVLLWHCQIAAMSPVQRLRERHSSPRTSRWGHLPGQTTARASGCSGQRSGSRSATSSELAASASRNLWTTARFRTAPGTSS